MAATIEDLKGDQAVFDAAVAGGILTSRHLCEMSPVN
jgi:hypothetical protein